MNLTDTAERTPRRRARRARVAGTVTVGAAVLATAIAPIASPRVDAGTEPVAPSRVLDTRSGSGEYQGAGDPGSRLDPGETLRLQVPRASAAGATAVVLNLTTDQAAGAGFVTAWPCDAGRPDTSILNYTSGRSIPNAVILKLPPEGLCFSSFRSVHLIADLMGWFTGSNDFVGTTPNRLLDTRQGQRLAAGETRRITVAGTSGVAGNAGAAALNFTVDRPAADGFVTVFDCGAVPNASTVNFRQGETVASFSVFGLAGRDICFRSSVATDLIVDSFGWSSGVGALRPISPTRLLDTRVGTGWPYGPASNQHPIRLRVAGRGGVPNDAAAALLTFTVDNGRSNGFVTAWPCDEPRPDTSILNLWSGVLRSNSALVKLSASGEVCVQPTTYDGSTVQLIADAVGWVTGGPSRSAPPAVPEPPPGFTERFETLPPGAVLPSDEECAARVRPAAEIRPENAQQNNTRGTSPNARYPRVTGDFVGTTDEILQWAACKWGIDEDLVRAQIVKESFWYMYPVGDGGQSYGLGQVRTTAHAEAFEDDNAIRSSAYNVDYTYAVWRDCYDGNLGWLNNVERGATYGPGDEWGCLGVWFSGRWYTDAAIRYIEGGPTNGYGDIGVREHLQRRSWTEASFVNH